MTAMRYIDHIKPVKNRDRPSENSCDTFADTQLCSTTIIFCYYDEWHENISVSHP